MSSFFCPSKNEISPNPAEVARYLGYLRSAPPTADVLALIEKACREMKNVLNPQAVYETFTLETVPAPENLLKFADVEIQSKALMENLGKCSKVVLFAATIGPMVDAMIRRGQKTDSVYAAILQATGAMYVEELVEQLNREIKQEAEQQGFSARPRFSPGYGDVPLSVQKDFFRLLPCTKIGLTLMDSLIMAPEKSVTAFIGLY